MRPSASGSQPRRPKLRQRRGPRKRGPKSGNRVLERDVLAGGNSANSEPRIGLEGMACGLAFFLLRDGYKSEGDTRVPFPIEQKLVVAVTSSALFDLSESQAVFLKEGEKAYREYERQKQSEVLKPRVASSRVSQRMARHKKIRCVRL